MLRALIVMCSSFALFSCGTLKPDVDVFGDHPMSWSNVREIEAQLPALGIRLPLYAIRMQGADRAEVSCAFSPFPLQGAAADQWNREGKVDFDAVVFTAVRRDGHWYAVRSSVKKTSEMVHEI